MAGKQPEKVKRTLLNFPEIRQENNEPLAVSRSEVGRGGIVLELAGSHL